MARKAKGRSLCSCMGYVRVQAVVLAMSATAGSEEVCAVCVRHEHRAAARRVVRLPHGLGNWEGLGWWLWAASACMTMPTLGDVATVPVCKTMVMAMVKQGECRCPSGGKAKACSLPCYACAKDMPHGVHGQCDGHDVLCRGGIPRAPSGGKAKACSLPCYACAKDMHHGVHGYCDGHDVLVEVASLEHHHVESH